jgi:uncharacterized protein DUF3592
MTNINRVNTNGGLFLSLFSIPFACVGLVTTFLIVWTIVVYIQQKLWVKTPAKITYTELVSHRSSKSTTYKVKATYDYDFNGKQYREADKVSQFMGSDNISRFHQDMYAKLKRCRDTGKIYYCFVNPEDPSEAVLYRGLRIIQLAFFSLFAVVFGGAGLGMMFSGIKMFTHDKKVRKNIAAFPEKPWLHKPEWRDGVIQASTKMVMFFSIIFAVFWNLISAPVVFAVFADSAVSKNSWIYLCLLFPLVGVGLFIWAVVNIVRMRKFGTSLFKMDSVPGVIGGRLAGRICTSVNIAPEEGFELSLRCVKQVVTGSGKNRSTREDLLWEDQQVIQRELLYRDLTRSEIPVLFAIPYEAKETSTDAIVRDTIIWRLKVKAAVSGLDYAATFEIPVFKTEESSADFLLAEEPAGLAESVSAADLLIRANIKVSPSYSSGGTLFTFPMARNISSGIFMTIFACIWTVIALALFSFKAPLAISIIWSIIDVFIVIGWLYTWFDYRVIDVDKYSIKMSGGLFGIGRTKTIDVKEFDKFEAKMSSKSNNVTYFRINAMTKAGKKITAAGGIRDKKLADALIEELNKSMGR